MEKLNAKNTQKVQIEKRTLQVRFPQNFCHFSVGDIVEYTGPKGVYVVEFLNSYKDPQKNIDPVTGKYPNGTKTFFEVTINGKPFKPSDIESIQKEIGAKKMSGEGQKNTHKRGLTKVKSLLNEALETSENERISGYLTEVIRIVEQEEQREAERRAEEARIAEEKKEAEAKLKNLKVRAQKMIAEGNFEEAMRLLERLK